MCAVLTVRECGPGLVLGHYQILERIGAGGMGEVFRARDLHLGRDIALKVLLPGTFSDQAARKRFRREALALSKLNHPNIAIVHDFDTDHDVDFLVLEYIEGLPLNSKLSKGALPEKEVVALGTQLAEGLSAAHAHGVVHRDLKPGNLRLSDDGRLKILDFGLAQLSVPTTPTAMTASMSEAEGLAGTLLYMAPEQLTGGLTDARTDIHAAGAVLYEMSTGRQPFAKVRGPERVSAILQSAPQPARTLNPRLTPELDRILGKCLERDPENRYQSAMELAVDLRRLGRDPNVATQTAAVLAHRPASGRRITVLVIAACIALLVAVGFLVRGRRGMSGVTRQFPIAASIAVLPFADLSPDHDHGYFSDGLAEEILNNLTKIPNLKVAARTSAFQFKGENADLKTIGEKLNVANILEGSVQSSGNRVRITVHLTEADVGQSLWSENYDRDLKDIFVVEDDIATAITSALQPKLLGRQTLQSPPPLAMTNPEAYQAFLLARSLNATLDTQLQHKAFEYIDQAVLLDPKYAPAFAQRSIMTAETALMTGESVDAALEKSRRDAQQAIRLDPNLAIAYRALSEVQAMADWDWKGAEQSAAKARELAPGDAEFVFQSGYLAMVQGQLEEAASLVTQGLALDPLSAGGYTRLAQILRDMGRYDEAHVAMQKSLELSPRALSSHEIRGELFLAQGHLQEASQEMDKEARGPWQDFGLALIGHALGNRAASDAALARLTTQSANGAAFQIAQVYAYRGEADQAFHWLNRAARQHDGGVGHFKVDWLLKNLRQDPRYRQLLKSVNLVP